MIDSRTRSVAYSRMFPCDGKQRPRRAISRAIQHVGKREFRRDLPCRNLVTKSLTQQIRERISPLLDAGTNSCFPRVFARRVDI
jgi:hypothetical protein